MKTIDKVKKQSEREIKRVYSIAIKEYLQKKDWNRLENELPAAEKIGVPKKHLQKAWMELGHQQKQQDKLVSAIVSFATARAHDLNNNRILHEIFECLDGFIATFESKFSYEDLVHLEYSLNRIYAFHKMRPETLEVNLKKAEELQLRLNALKLFAPSRRETVASSNIQKIYAALYTEMTPEEVRTEFARLFMAMNGGEYNKRLNDKKRARKIPPASSGGQKPPKDKDETGEEENPLP